MNIASSRSVHINDVTNRQILGKGVARTACIGPYGPSSVYDDRGRRYETTIFKLRKSGKLKIAAAMHEVTCTMCIHAIRTFRLYLCETCGQVHNNSSAEVSSICHKELSEDAHLTKIMDDLNSAHDRLYTYINHCMSCGIGDDDVIYQVSRMHNGRMLCSKCSDIFMAMIDATSAIGSSVQATFDEISLAVNAAKAEMNEALNRKHEAINKYITKSLRKIRANSNKKKASKRRAKQ